MMMTRWFPIAVRLGRVPAFALGRLDGDGYHPAKTRQASKTRRACIVGHMHGMAWHGMYLLRVQQAHKTHKHTQRRLCCAVLCCAVLCCTLLRFDVLCCDVAAAPVWFLLSAFCIAFPICCSTGKSVNPVSHVTRQFSCQAAPSSSRSLCPCQPVCLSAPLFSLTIVDLVAKCDQVLPLPLSVSLSQDELIQQ
jgi:hypothetical protein